MSELTRIREIDLIIEALEDKDWSEDALDHYKWLRELEVRRGKAEATLDRLVSTATSFRGSISNASIAADHGDMIGRLNKSIHDLDEAIAELDNWNRENPGEQ